MSQILVPIFGAAAFLTGALFYTLQTVPAVRRALADEA
jgi:hypothetical protein